MKSAVIVFPGSNCDRDMAEALRLVTGRAPEMVWHREAALPHRVDLVAIPGGFSYGDYLRSGAMAAQSPVMRAVRDAAERGVPVLGVCNGFQVLTESHLLPGALMRNSGMAFVCRDVALRVENSQSVFTNGYEAGEEIVLPVAHHDGNYQADEDTLARLEGERDDISGVGQTKAALSISTGLPKRLKRYHLALGVGHYGIFHGGKWRNRIAPIVEDWIARHD